MNLSVLTPRVGGVLLTLTATASDGFPDATALGFVLHKHPGKVQRFPVSAGTATVLYPAASPELCTVALVVDLDPLELARGDFHRSDPAFALGQYVNDRPYAGASFLAVALRKVFATAVAGNCPTHPHLVDAVVPLVVRVPVVPVRGGAGLARRLFEPLGWRVRADPVPLGGPWGDSRYVALTLEGSHPVRDALRHLYVLLPVLDDAKHYWVGEDEVDKLLFRAGRWLPAHPEAALITSRYLAHKRKLVAAAADRLGGDSPTPAQPPAPRPTLQAARVEAVLAALAAVGARTVVDLGCGEGQLLRRLAAHPGFTRVVGADVSDRALTLAARRVTPDERVSLWQSSATYRDRRLEGFDAVVLMEVVEHVDAGRLPALEQAVLGHARPRHVLVTTPNAEYNALFPDLSAGAFRHPDHRFEFTRDQFRRWAGQAACRHGYTVAFEGVASADLPVDAALGPPTQLAVFTRREGH